MKFHAEHQNSATPFTLRVSAPDILLPYNLFDDATNSYTHTKRNAE